MEQENKTPAPMTFKSHIIVPFMFVFTLAVAICFATIKGFTYDLNKVIVWFYFAINLIYIGIALYDLYINKEKSQKQKRFVAVMCALDFIATILYAIFYIIAK